VQGRISKDWVTVIAHKITGPNGEFLGLVTRAIRPASFEKFFASMALGDGASIAILHHDGTLLGRYPHVQAMIGLNFKNAPVNQRILSKSDHGTTRIISAIDGLSRLASARALTEFPIVIIATTTVSAALADWREQLSYLIAAAGNFGTAVLVGAVALAGLRGKAFPSWFVAASGALAAAFIVAGIGVATFRNEIATVGLVVFLVWALWVVVISVLMLRRPARATT